MRVDDDEFADARMGKFGVAQARRNDAGHPTALRERGIGGQTHQPDPPAAKD